MVVTVTLLADCAARLHPVDTRRVMLKYRQRRAIFRNELSLLVYVREKFNMNAVGVNELGKGGCHLSVSDAEKHGRVGQCQLDWHLCLRLSSTTRGTFLVRRR